NGDEAGEILILRSQSIDDPRAHARAHLRIAARVQLQRSTAMRGIRAVHGANDTQIVRALRKIRKQLADGQAAFAILPELPWRFQQLAGFRKLDARFLEWIFPSIIAR